MCCSDVIDPSVAGIAPVRPGLSLSALEQSQWGGCEQVPAYTPCCTMLQPHAARTGGSGTPARTGREVRQPGRHQSDHWPQHSTATMEHDSTSQWAKGIESLNTATHSDVTWMPSPQLIPGQSSPGSSLSPHTSWANGFTHVLASRPSEKDQEAPPVASSVPHKEQLSVNHQAHAS